MANVNSVFIAIWYPNFYIKPDLLVAFSGFFKFIFLVLLPSRLHFVYSYVNGYFMPESLIE